MSRAKQSQPVSLANETYGDVQASLAGLVAVTRPCHAKALKKNSNITSSGQCGNLCWEMRRASRGEWRVPPFGSKRDHATVPNG